MIAQGFEFTRDFLMERNNNAYFRLKKISCELKEQTRARQAGDKCGLTPMFRNRLARHLLYALSFFLHPDLLATAGSKIGEPIGGPGLHTATDR
jgi:hypothetical protein